MTATLDFRSKRMVYSGGRRPPEEWQGRDWGRGQWSFPVCGDIYKRLAALNEDEIDVTANLRRQFQSIKAKQLRLKAIRDQEDCDGESRLYPYQRVGVQWLKAIERGILADDRGIGKTVEAVVAAKELEISRGLVICAKGPLTASWKRHLVEWGGYAQDRILVLDSTTAKRLVDRDYDWIITNQAQVSLHLDMLMELDLEMLILDEAHVARNRKTKVFQDYKRLARIPYVFLLTGSPKVNQPADFWPLLYLADPTRFGSYWSFVFRFCTVTNNGYGLKVGDLRPDEVENLGQILSVYMLRRNKEDVLDLPERRTRFVDCEMTEEQAKLYEQMALKALVECEDELVSADVKIAQITRLRQLVTDPGALFTGYSGGSGKLATLISEVREAPGKVVVFSQFAEVVDRAATVLREAGFQAVTLTGKRTNKQRAEAEAALQEGDAKVLLATIKTGGEGLTLTAASKVVFLDPAWHPAGQQQAEDRIYRISQKADLVESVILQTSHTIDDFMWDTINRKDKVSVDDVLTYLRGEHAKT